jgi:hypothetical protein
MLLALGVSLEHVRLALQWRTENEVLATWRDERLSRRLASTFGVSMLFPA